MLCSLKLSSRMADWSFVNRSFFLEFSPPSSSSLKPREEALSTSISSPAPAVLVESLSAELLLPLNVETVLFGDETATSSSSPPAGLLTSIPRRNDRHVSEFRSEGGGKESVLRFQGSFWRRGEGLVEEEGIIMRFS